MLLHKVSSITGDSVTLDAFACHQSQRYVSRHSEPVALASDGLVLNWRCKVVWLNPPCALLPTIIGKVDVEKPGDVLIVPYWTSRPWQKGYSFCQCTPGIVWAQSFFRVGQLKMMDK